MEVNMSRGELYVSMLLKDKQKQGCDQKKDSPALNLALIKGT